MSNKIARRATTGPPSKGTLLCGLASLAVLSGLIAASVFGSTTGSGPTLSSFARSEPATGATAISVTATNSYSFTPNTFEQVATNSTISVTFTDATVLANTFTIIGKEGWVIPSSYTSAQIDQLAYGGSPPNLVNVNVTGSGDVNSATFESPGPGWYEFVCTELGHFQLGMYGFIAFGENLPGNLSLSPVASGLSGSAASASSVVLHWENPPVGEFTNITALYGTSNVSLPNRVSAGTATTITISGLDSDTTYYFAIEAWNNSVNGPISAHIAVTTQSGGLGSGGLFLGVNQAGWYLFLGTIGVVAVLAALLVIRSRQKRKESASTEMHDKGSGPPNPPK